MYPGFYAAAVAEDMSYAASIFNRTLQVEQVHAGNFNDLMSHFNDASYLNENYSTVYRCLFCGIVVKTLPTRCPICWAEGSTFAVYGALEPSLDADYTALYAAIVAAAQLVEDDYTAASWAVLAAAVADGQAVDRNLTVNDQSVIDDAAAAINDAIDALVTKPVTPPTPTVTVNGVEIEIEIINGVATIDLTKLTDEQIRQILDGDPIVFDLSGYDKVDIKAPADCFKDYDKVITINTSNGNGTVKTKTLWNNSGKNRLITVRNGKVTVENI